MVIQTENFDENGRRINNDKTDVYTKKEIMKMTSQMLRRLVLMTQSFKVDIYFAFILFTKTLPLH